MCGKCRLRHAEVGGRYIKRIIAFILFVILTLQCPYTLAAQEAYTDVLDTQFARVEINDGLNIIKTTDNAVRYNGDFVVDVPKTKFVLKDIERQGFPFFCSSITVAKNIVVDNVNKKLVLDMLGINAVSISVNGNYVQTVICNGAEVDISR